LLLHVFEYHYEDACGKRRKIHVVNTKKAHIKFASYVLFSFSAAQLSHKRPTNNKTTAKVAQLQSIIALQYKSKKIGVDKSMHSYYLRICESLSRVQDKEVIRRLKLSREWDVGALIPFT
jgi:hypothetical protein